MSIWNGRKGEIDRLLDENDSIKAENKIYKTSNAAWKAESERLKRQFENAIEALAKIAEFGTCPDEVGLIRPKCTKTSDCANCWRQALERIE